MADNTRTVDITPVYSFNTETDLTKPVKNIVATSFEIRYPNFVEMVGIATRAEEARTANDNGTAAMRRQRVKECVKLNGGDGKPYSITAIQLSMMPISASKILFKNLFDDTKEAGTIIQDGDGINEAVLYKLGTPLEMGNDSVKELEFFAKTYGDIEAVLSAPTNIEQAAELIKRVAKAPGTSFTTLPSWALSQVTVADGYTILDKILPRFLD